MHSVVSNRENQGFMRSKPPRVAEILSWYAGENNAVVQNLFRMLNTGRLAGSGRMVILPVDQGFEHGPARSFAKNPPAYDPAFHFELAIESGCSAYAAPYGQLAVSARDFVGEIPIIVKVNNNDSLFSSKNPVPAVTCSVREALLLGACAIGFTIYPGSSFRKEMFEEIREMSEEAKSYGLPTVIWSYPRGENLSKEGETAVDVVAYAAHIACQLGAHIVKVKPPSAHVEQEAARKVYKDNGIEISSLEQRISHVVKSAFNGKRIVIFSGGEAKGSEEILKDAKAIRDGGGFGSIIGRNSFQRTKEEGLALLSSIMDVYSD